jgi:hypothetical protein
MENEWMKLGIKDKLAYIFACLALTFGFGITLAGFLVPPLGEVDDSVLWILGQTLIYSGSLVGITVHYQNELGKFKKDIEKLIK